MLRYFFLLLLVLSVSLIFLNGRLQSTNSEKPIFLQYDAIADEHQSKVDVQSNAAIKPTKEQVEVLKKDYTNIWAHLNHLYATNNVVAGKEYYT
jgi:hypothetical protein